MTVIISGTTGIDTVQDAKISPAKLTSNGSGGFSLPCSAGNGLSIDSSGRVTTPYQPAFFVGKTNQITLTAPTTVVFNDVTFNIGSHYNSATGIFTAPVSGRYWFSTNLASASGVDDIIFQIKVNGVSKTGAGTQTTVQSGQEITSSTSAVLNLSANDQVTVYTDRNLRCDNAITCNFSGFLIG